MICWLPKTRQCIPGTIYLGGKITIMNIPSAVGRTIFSWVSAFFRHVVLKPSSSLFRSPATLGKSLRDGLVGLAIFYTRTQKRQTHIYYSDNIWKDARGTTETAVIQHAYECGGSLAVPRQFNGVATGQTATGAGVGCWTMSKCGGEGCFPLYAGVVQGHRQTFVRPEYK